MTRSSVMRPGSGIIVDSDMGRMPSMLNEVGRALRSPVYSGDRGFTTAQHESGAQAHACDAGKCRPSATLWTHGLCWTRMHPRPRSRAHSAKVCAACRAWACTRPHLRGVGGARFIDRAVSGPELVSGSHVHSLGISYRVPVLPGPGEAPLPMPTVPLTVFLGEIGEHIWGTAWRQPPCTLGR